MKYQLLSDKVVFKSKFLHMKEVKFRLNNIQRKWWHFLFPPCIKWWYASRPNKRAAVMIVPIIEYDEEVPMPMSEDTNIVTKQKLVLTKEFRRPIKDYEWGFPAGLVDGDESVLKTIERELLEETGYSVKKIICISQPVYSSAGMTDEEITIAYVKCSSKAVQPQRDADEDIEVFVMDDSQVKTILYDPCKKFGAKAWVVLDFFARTGKVV